MHFGGCGMKNKRSMKSDRPIIQEATADQEAIADARTPGHVALFMQSFAGGGAERVMINLAYGLAARGWRVDLLVSRVEGPYFALIKPGIRLIDLGCRRSLTSLPALALYLRREKPDALLSAMGVSNLIALWAASAARFRGRVVVSVHINLSFHYKHAVGVHHKLFPYMYRRFYPKADAIVAVSEESAADLRDVFGMPAARVRMIYNPVVSPALLAQADEPVDHHWFAPGQPPVILAVGRLCEQKDYPTLLRAFAKIQARTRVNLLILGEGSDRAALEKLVIDLELGGRVEMPGFQSNPYAYMAQAAVYVLSSRWEGLPTVLIEALACGTPVVSTDCPSGPEEILCGGKYGRLVPVGDSDALAIALEESLGGENGQVPTQSWAAFASDQAAANYEKVLWERSA